MPSTGGQHDPVQYAPCETCACRVAGALDSVLFAWSVGPLGTLALDLFLYVHRLVASFLRKRIGRTTEVVTKDYYLLRRKSRQTNTGQTMMSERQRADLGAGKRDTELR